MNALSRRLKGLGVWAMAYECKVYDKNGKLKKVLRGNEVISKTSQSFLKQKSTQKAVSYIRTFKEPSKDNESETKFYNNRCVVCRREFHPRHPQSKYCSHECQKSLYLKNKKLKKERK